MSNKIESAIVSKSKNFSNLNKADLPMNLELPLAARSLSHAIVHTSLEPCLVHPKTIFFKIPRHSLPVNRETNLLNLVNS